MVDDYRDYLIASGRSENTAKSYASDVAQFLQFVIGDTDPFDEQCAKFINSERARTSPNSVLRRMAALRSYAKFMRQNDPLWPVPFTNYKGPRSIRGMAHPLPGLMSDVDALVAVASKHQHKLLIGLCGYCGLRVSEARSVTPRSVFQDSQGNAWLAIHGKGGAYREVPIPGQLEALIRSSSSAGPDEPFITVADRGARQAIERLGARAGIGKVSSHDLRMTYGSVVYAATKDLRLAQELLGHASVNTTQTYTGIGEKSKLEAVERVFS